MCDDGIYYYENFYTKTNTSETFGQSYKRILNKQLNVSSLSEREEELITRHDRVMTTINFLERICGKKELYLSMCPCEYVYELRKRLEISTEDSDIKNWERTIANEELRARRTIRRDGNVSAEVFGSRI